MVSLVCAEEIAYHEIRQRILDGRLAPGERLVHRAVAKDLDMSSNPVVLALRMLERDGLVVNTPGLGACVRVWNKEEIIDSYHIRAFLEALAARLCAERHLSPDMDAIDKAHMAYQLSNSRQDAEANVLADIDLHMMIAQGAHCADLERIFENMSLIHRCMNAFGIYLNVPRLLGSEFRDTHAPIIAAIRARDMCAAEQAARTHVEESLARNLAWIEQVSTVLESSGHIRSGTRR
ncbi:MAG: GntR family transcriptional regulator [Armatimonadota bacterium]